MAYMGALTLGCPAGIAEEHSLVLVKVRRNFDIEESALSLGLNDGETHDLFSLKGLEVEPPEPSAPFGDQELVRGDKGHPPRMVKLLAERVDFEDAVR